MIPTTPLSRALPKVEAVGPFKGWKKPNSKEPDWEIPDITQICPNQWGDTVEEQEASDWDSDDDVRLRPSRLWDADASDSSADEYTDSDDVDSASDDYSDSDNDEYFPEAVDKFADGYVPPPVNNTKKADDEDDWDSMPEPEPDSDTDSDCEYEDYQITLPAEHGLEFYRHKVRAVAPDSAASEADIWVGDRLLEVRGGEYDEKQQTLIVHEDSCELIMRRVTDIFTDIPEELVFPEDEDIEELFMREQQVRDSVASQRILTGKVIKITSAPPGARVEVYPGIVVYVPMEEMAVRPIASVDEVLKLGQQVSVVPIGKAKSEVIYSMKRLLLPAAWRELLHWNTTDASFNTIAWSINHGGVQVITPMGLIGFIPNSQFVGELTPKVVGKQLKVKPMSVDPVVGKLLLSMRRHLMSVSPLPLVGQIYNGTVNKVLANGIIVNLDNGHSGLIHPRQLSQDPVNANQLESVFRLQQRIKVLVTKINRFEMKMDLNTRVFESYPGEMLTNPQSCFDQAEQRYALFDEEVKAGKRPSQQTKVTEVFGEEDDYDGFEYEDEEEEEVEEEVPVPETNTTTSALEAGTIVQGKVTMLKPFGVFVDLDNKLTGLLHLSQISQTRLDAALLPTIFKVDQQIKVLISEISPMTGKVTLNTRVFETYPGEMIKDSKACFANAVERFANRKSTKNRATSQLVDRLARQAAIKAVSDSIFTSGDRPHYQRKPVEQTSVKNIMDSLGGTDFDDSAPVRWNAGPSMAANPPTPRPAPERDPAPVPVREPVYEFAFEKKQEEEWAPSKDKAALHWADLLPEDEEQTQSVKAVTSSLSSPEEEISAEAAVPVSSAEVLNPHQAEDVPAAPTDATEVLSAHSPSQVEEVQAALLASTSATPPSNDEDPPLEVSLMDEDDEEVPPVPAPAQAKEVQAASPTATSVTPLSHDGDRPLIAILVDEKEEEVFAQPSEMLIPSSPSLPAAPVSAEQSLFVSPAALLMPQSALLPSVMASSEQPTAVRLMPQSVLLPFVTSAEHSTAEVLMPRHQSLPPAPPDPTADEAVEVEALPAVLEPVLSVEPTVTELVSEMPSSAPVEAEMLAPPTEAAPEPEPELTSQAQEEVSTTPKRRGRPPGSKNKTKDG